MDATSNFAALQAARASSAAELRNFGSGQAPAVISARPSTTPVPSAISPPAPTPAVAAPVTAASPQLQQPKGRIPRLKLARDASTLDTLNALNAAMSKQPAQSEAVARMYEVQQKIFESYKAAISAFSSPTRP